MPANVNGSFGAAHTVRVSGGIRPCCEGDYGAASDNKNPQEDRAHRDGILYRVDRQAPHRAAVVGDDGAVAMGISTRDRRGQSQGQG